MSARSHPRPGQGLRPDRAPAAQPSASQPDGLAEVLRRHRMMGTSDVDCVCAADGCWWTSTNGVDWYDHLAEAVRAHLAQTAPEPAAADLLAVTLAVDALRSEQRDAVAQVCEHHTCPHGYHALLAGRRDESCGGCQRLLAIAKQRDDAVAEAWDEGYEAGDRARAVNPDWPERTRNPHRGAERTDPEAGGGNES